MKDRILVIISSWPSIEHPYLVYLFSGLKENFPHLRFFLFKHAVDTQFADDLIGADRKHQVLDNALYRFKFTINPISYFNPMVKILLNPIESIRIYKSCLANGYSVKKAIGQLFYGYQLIGERFDLVYINALQTGRHIAISSLFPDSKKLASSRGQDFDWNPTGYDTLLLQLDHLHVLGTHLLRRATARKFPVERITIIPPASLPNIAESIQRKIHDTSTIQIATAARLIWTKGFIYSLRAVGRLKKMLHPHPIRYVIMGDGADFDLLKFEVKRLKLEEQVIFRGWVSQDEVDQCLLESDIYLLLSIEEGFNNSVMQAQSLGLPCVVSDAGGLPDNVSDEVTGFVVPRYNVRKAADCLYQLIVDKKGRERMGENARKRMRREFSLAIQVEKYSSLFKRVLSEVE